MKCLDFFKVEQSFSLPLQVLILFNPSSESEISVSEQEENVSPSEEYPVSVISSSRIWLNSLSEGSVSDEKKHNRT